METNNTNTPIYGIECVKCKTRLFSLYCHDFVTCKCGAVSLDGGFDYQKISYSSASSFITITMDNEDYKREAKRFKNRIVSIDKLISLGRKIVENRKNKEEK